MHITLEAMTSWARKAIGDIPEPMVGPSMTLVTIPHPDIPQQTKTQIWMYGGRSVKTRRVCSGLWCLDVETLVWERVESGEETEGNGEGWPRGRYFHTADRWGTKLVIFGGMGLTPSLHNGSPTAESPAPISASTEASIIDPPCVLNGLWVFDCVTRKWTRPRNANVGINFDEGILEPVENLPAPRYAHTSVISRGKLIITGGQDLHNDYIMQGSTLDLPSMTWEPAFDIVDHRGSYRSVSVSSRYTLEPQTTALKDDYGNPLEPLPYSLAAPGGGGDVYTYSNSNFTDVRRQIQLSRFDETGNNLSTTDVTQQLTARSQNLPPGLRFPYASIIGNNLVIAGTYLSAHEQEYTVWVLDLRKAKWRKIEAMVLGSGNRAATSADAESLGGGSWNKAVTWEEAGKLMVFGNKSRSLAEDYEQRAINFDHVAIVDLEMFGIYQPPVRTPCASPRMIPFALKSLRESWSSDFHIVCEDGRALACSRRILEERWPWFKTNRGQVAEKAQEALGDLTFAVSPDLEGRAGASSTDIGEQADKVGTARFQKWKSGFKIEPQTLQLSEPYPVCKALLEYFYTYDLVTPLQHRAPILSALLILSKQYELDDLKKKVVYAMHERLTGSNCLGIYEIACLCACTSLQVRALRLVLAMQKREGRNSTHRRDDSGAGLTPSSARPSPGGGSSGGLNGSMSANGDGRQRSAGTRMPNSSGNGGMNGYAMNLPPSSYRLSKSPRTRSPSPSTCSLKASPLPIPEETIFTFPPRAEASTSAVQPGEAAAGRRLRPIASQPVLNGWKMAALQDHVPLGTVVNAARGTPSSMNDSEVTQDAEPDYDPPSFRARPRTASLKSVHHYQNGLHDLATNQRDPIDSAKENRPRSSTLSPGRHRRGLGKSQSISSFFGMPSATSSIGWIGQHILSRPPSERGAVSSAAAGTGGLDVVVAADTASTNTVVTPSTAASTASSTSEAMAWTDPSDGLVFWQEGADQSRRDAPHHQRLCSLGEENDVKKTPVAKRTLQVDTRLAQTEFRQPRRKRDSVDLRASPRGEMPLFFVPPGQVRQGSPG